MVRSGQGLLPVHLVDFAEHDDTGKARGAGDGGSEDVHAHGACKRVRGVGGKGKNASLPEGVSTVQVLSLMSMGVKGELCNNCKCEARSASLLKCGRRRRRRRTEDETLDLKLLILIFGYAKSGT